jgi:hypothetical protein
MIPTMATPKLTVEQINILFRPLFQDVVSRLQSLANGDRQLLWALRRKLTKELNYLERGKPIERAKLKTLKRMEQKGLCAIKGEPLPTKGAVLDRFEAFLGYTAENTRLICPECDAQEQERKKYC